MSTRTVLGLLAAVGAWGAVWLVARSAPVPEGLGVVGGELAACPGTPNCVRTTGPARGAAEEAEPSSDPPHFILRTNDEDSWTRLVDLVGSMARTRIVQSSPDYVHAEARTAVFRFVDDLELLRLPDLGQVQVRSASRLGAGDLGVNAKRVSRLRDLAVEARLIEPTNPPPGSAASSR